MTTESNDSVYPDPMRSVQDSHYGINPLELQSGLTKREYFAAMAMQGLLARIGYGEEVAGYSVKFADQLIKALNKQP